MLRFQRQPAGVRDVEDMDEIPTLLAVFEHHRRAAIEEPGCEYREYTGVRIRQRLSRSIDVKKAKCRRGNTIGLSHHQTEPLLGIFVEGINRAERRRLGLWGRHRGQSLTVCIFQFPSSAPQLLRRSLCRIHQSVRAIPAQTLPVNAHGGGDDQPCDWSFREGFKQCCGSDLVVVHIRDHVVHALANTDGRCQMQHEIYSPQSAVQRSGIGNIAYIRSACGFRYPGGCRDGPWTCGVRLSSSVTWYPASTRRSEVCEPMKPAPPVIRTRVIS